MFIEVPTPPGALRRTSSMDHAKATHNRWFRVMGESLHFQTNTATLLAAASDAFDRFPQPPEVANHPGITQGAPLDPLIIRLFVRDGSPPAEGVYPRPIFHTLGHLFYLNAGAENTIVVDLRKGYAIGFVTPAVAEDRSFVRYTFIEAAALAMLGRARDFVAVHAAAVVKHGVSILIQGKPGAGKTTLAFACLCRGFQVLAEDVVQVKVASGGLRLWGMPWKFHLLPDSMRFFPAIADHSLYMQVNGEWKVEVELDDLFPGATVTQAAPGPVVFLERAIGRHSTRFERLGMAEARTLFEVVWSWEEGWQEAYEDALGQLLAQGSYRLYMNGTPSEAVDALEALFAEWQLENRECSQAIHV